MSQESAVMRCAVLEIGEAKQKYCSDSLNYELHGIQAA